MADGKHLGEAELKDIVEGAMAGRHDAFHVLYEHLVDRLYGYAHLRSASHAEALDIVQDTFVDLWSALGRFTYRSSGHFYSFVFTILKRRLYRHYRTHVRTESIDDLAPGEHPRSEAVIDDPDGMRELVGQLSEKYRDVVTLRYWSGLSFAEIADTLGQSETNVKVRHHRALKQLRELMQRNG